MSIRIKKGWLSNRIITPLMAIMGFLKGVTTNHKFGFNPSVGVTYETVWNLGGVYSYLSAATILKISSDNAADASAGTGLQTVEIHGLDGNYNEISEVVTLNGQTEVNTTNSYLRIYRMIGHAVGSGGTNTGVIYAGTGTVTAGVPANKYAGISVGDGQTLMSLVTVPKGKTAYIYNWVSNSASNKETSLRLYQRHVNEGFHIHDSSSVYRSESKHDYSNALIKVEEKTDIEVRAKVDSTTGEVSSSLSILFISN